MFLNTDLYFDPFFDPTGKALEHKLQQQVKDYENNIKARLRRDKPL